MVLGLLDDTCKWLQKNTHHGSINEDQAAVSNDKL